MTEKTKPISTPTVCIDHDMKNYSIQVELPGVEKENVELEVSEQGFCVKGTRPDVEFVGCYFLAHPVNADKVKAKFNNGLLDVIVPLTQPLTGKKVTIE